MLRLFFAISASIFLCGCNNLKKAIDVYDPPVLENDGSDLYYIRTRIVVEVIGGAAAKNINEIIEDLWFAEKIYSDLGIKFIISEMSLADPNQEWDGYSDLDSVKYENTMSIYYTFSKKYIPGKSPIVGMGMFPWYKNPNGICINGHLSETNTLAHEVGHFFGLYHTFGVGEFKEDFVDDTLNEQEYLDKIGEDAFYKEYNNIMNYHWFGKNSFVTDGQINRMRHYLLKDRKSMIMDGDLRDSPNSLNIFKELFKDIPKK